MKNKLMNLYDRLMLRKRTVIESVNDFLKNICEIEHSGHRSIKNFLVNLLSALAAYSFLPKKPSICPVSNMPKGILCLVDWFFPSNSRYYSMETVCCQYFSGYGWLRYGYGALFLHRIHFFYIFYGYITLFMKSSILSGYGGYGTFYKNSRKI